MFKKVSAEDFVGKKFRKEGDLLFLTKTTKGSWD